MLSKSFFKLSMICLLLLSCTGGVAGNHISSDFSAKIIETHPSSEHISNIMKIFSKASHITVKHIPNANIGSGLDAKEDLANYWRYMFAFNCRVTCEKNAKKIKDYFSSGLLLDRACPKFYSTLIELTADNKIVSKIFVHQTGHCFTLNDKSYVTESSFVDFVDESKLYPDFVDVE